MTTNLVKNYLSKITDAWKSSVEKIFEAAQLLAEAEQKLETLEWMELVSALPITQSTVVKLISIGNNKFLHKNVQYLPPHWTTIYEISTMPETTVKQWIKDNVISPSSERQQILNYKNQLSLPSPTQNSTIPKTTQQASK